MIVPPQLLVLLALSVSLGGMALLWLVAQIPLTPERPRHAGVVSLRIVGWTLLLVGFLGAVTIATSAISILVWVATLAIFLTSLGRYYSAERQSLLWVLTIACEKGIPLADAARAFAAERNDSVARSSLKLADYLDSGVPLSLAAERSRIYLPPAARLALEIGPQTNSLGVALRQLVGRSDDRDRLVRSVLAKLLYLSLLVIYTIGLTTFQMLYILPRMQKIYSDFGLRLPTVTLGAIEIANWLSSPFIAIPFLVVWLVIVISALVGYARSTVPNVPGIRWLRGTTDHALILRWLAVAIREKRPIQETLRRLAIHFPIAATQRRLERASQRVDRGADWNESLRASHLIGNSESVLLKSAERVGNLSWAMDEMAESSLRRANYRLRAFVDVAFFASLLVFGMAVLGIVLAVFVPLLSLIQGLS